MKAELDSAAFSKDRNRPPVSPSYPAGQNAVIEILRFELSRRAQKNPNYSLRSFARYLGISHALLSLVLSGKRAPSRSLIEKIGDKLCLSPQKTDQLLKTHGQPESQFLRKKKKHESKLSLDEFTLISEWQHYAILSLLQVADTKLEPNFIAKRLGISPLLAKLSMQRLFNLKIIVQDGEGKWRQKPGPIIVENTKSTSSTRKFQKQLMAKAVHSLENDSIEKRDFSSTTFAMDPKLVPYALERIRQFRRQLTDELETLGTPKEVYNLTVQIFPSSHREQS
jgi:uncharacterized protein (TIGR02147 family)